MIDETGNMPGAGDGYEPLCRIGDVEDFRSGEEVLAPGDRRDGKLYRYTDDLKLGVNVALATGRPLLVLGPTGCGKSSLAFNLARALRRRYYEFVVTSRTQARDLLYRFDAVRRLGDAQPLARLWAEPSEAEPLESYYAYIEPGPLWWILDRASATRRGLPGERVLRFRSAVDPKVWGPEAEDGVGSVLLIDEVDKAEPDFPNNLLVPLGSYQFVIEEVSRSLRLADAEGLAPDVVPLVIITSNQERELPEAFVRRCVVLEIRAPRAEDLVEIGRVAFAHADPEVLTLVATRLEELRGSESLSTAEFLDTVKAVLRLKATGQSLTEVVLRSSWRAHQP